MSEMNGSAVKSAVPVSDGRQTPTSTSSSPTASFNDTSDTNGILQQQQQGSPPPSDAVIRTETAAPAPINFATVVNDLRTTFQSGKTKDVSFRIQQLKALQRMLKENEMKIVETPAMEIRGSEIDFCVNEIEVMLHNIHDWTKEKRVPKCMVTLFDKPSRRPEPYGVALVMGAWNYPVSLTFTPVTGAIAAGNCVVIKPSDVAPNTAQLFSELISKYLDSSCYKVVCGGVAETTDLLKQRFDYIFFTGGYRVGKIVREASNRHLTPCTLELGGKSPVYLDDSVNNMDIAVKRIIWGKLVNAGQSCIAPDYMLCTREVQDIFVNKARELIKEFFGNKPQESASFGRIINNSHFQRLTGLLHSGVVAVGGDVDPSDLYIAPTILVNVKPDDPVMQEEIFGPILPIINVDSAKEAMDFINAREKPLTVYCFASNAKTIEMLKFGTSSGTFVTNDNLVHFLVSNLPFGGVGESGMGQYHGKASFDTFSHTKSILNKDYNRLEERIGSVRYPPFSEKKLDAARFLMKKRRFVGMEYLPYVLFFLLGVLTVLIIQKLTQETED